MIEQPVRILQNGTYDGLKQRVLWDIIYDRKPNTYIFAHNGFDRRKNREYFIGNFIKNHVISLNYEYGGIRPGFLL